MKKMAAILAGVMIMASGSALALPLNNGPSTIGNPSSGQIGLQEIVNTVFGDNKINVNDDQTGIGGWVYSENDTASFRVVANPLVGDTALQTNAGVGIYDLVTGQEHLLFRLQDDPGASFQFSGGNLFLNNKLDTDSSGWSGQFGFFAFESDGYNVQRYTEDSKNSGVNYAASYLLKDGWAWDTSALNYTNYGTSVTSGTMRGNNDWLLAFDTEGSVWDYNDVVFMVEDMSPVPEPGTMVLLGFGLLGLAIYGKRRMNNNQA